MRRSSRALAALLIAFAAGLAGFALWLGSSGDEEVQASAPVSAAAPDRVRHSERPVAPVEPEVAEIDPEPTTTSTLVEPTEAERTDASEAELEGAIWVEGRVVLPRETPLDTEVRIEARGKKFEHREFHGAEIAPDGSFRVAFAPKTRIGKLHVDSNWLYVEKTPSLRLAEVDRSAIELELELGARIEGVVLAEFLTEEERETLVGASVSLMAWERTGDSFAGSVQKEVELDERLEFELGALSPKVTYDVDCDPDWLVGREAERLVVKAGEITRVELELRRGAHVTGTVLDEGGEPVEGSALSAWSDTDDWSTSSSEIEVKADGTYVGRGIEPADTALVASAKGYLDRRLDLGELADGDLREGVALVLTRGNHVAGTVQWPDGRPVADCTVTLREPEPDYEDEDVPFAIWSHDDEVTEKTDEGGRFRFTGLGPGPFELSAKEYPELEPLEGESKLKRRRRQKEAGHRTARIEDVAADTNGLVLTLARGLTLAGSVVDDLGAPVERYTVSARPSDENEWDDTHEVRALVRDEAGSFQLAGVYEGRWTLQVRAEGYVQTHQSVEVPARGQQVLTVSRAAQLTGTVVDPAGRPVDDAVVTVTAPGAALWQIWDNDESDRTDEDGRFELEAPVGRVRLHAEAPDYASSEMLKLVLAAGEERAGITLALRIGGRITGELRSSSGESIAGRTVSIAGNGGVGELSDHPNRTTDAAGRFEFEGLAPGTYTVSAEPTEEQAKEFRDEDGDRDWAAWMAATKESVAKIEAAETVHVVLGAPSATSVRVTGRVHRGGAPLAGADVWISGASEGSAPTSTSASTAEDGTFEATVPAPGEYSFWVSHESADSLHTETIPDVDTHAVELEVATGSISGRVLGPDGEPLEEIELMLSGDAAASNPGFGGFLGSATTDEGGAFRFEGVRAGTFAVTAVSEVIWGITEEPEHGVLRVGGIHVEDGGAVTDLVLRLERAGAIEGYVDDAEGRRAVGATVFVRGASGRVMNSYSAILTDGAGRYRLPGLSPGQWSVSARRGYEVSAESRPVRVSSDGTAEVDVRLGPGALLKVSTLDSEGESVSAAVSVRDDAGREYTNVYALADQDLYEGAFWSGTIVGPLPPGVYSVSATFAEDETVETTVTLDGTDREISLSAPE